MIELRQKHKVGWQQMLDCYCRGALTRQHERNENAPIAAGHWPGLAVSNYRSNPQFRFAHTNRQEYFNDAFGENSS